MDDDAPHPVELLRDARGIYGIGASELFDFELTAARCGIEPKPYSFERPPLDLILRPDWFHDTKPHTAVLHKITGGFRHGIFTRTSEEHLRQFIHHAALNRAGLPWPPPHRNSLGWWSDDTKQQARNRGIYHGLRQLSLGVINKLIDQALEAAADADAIKQARRFMYQHRVNIYRAGALSRRALQLTETFPVLALAIYSSWRFCEANYFEMDWKALEAHDADLKARKSEAAHLVDRGARLRDVAGLMKISMALRVIKPGVAHLASDVFRQHPDLLNFLPATTPRQRIWLPVVAWATNKINADFGAWAARHVPEIPGRTHRVVGNILGDLADFAHPLEGSEFITRKFEPSMSLKTVTALSADWHEAVANNLAEGPNATFPPPWYPTATLGNYEIIPIKIAAELYREGTAMHHCAGTYRARVQSGELYFYSIRRNGERLATLALFKQDGHAGIQQCRGPCNAEPPQAIFTLVRRWISAQPPLPTLQETDPSLFFDGDPFDVPFNGLREAAA